MFKIFFNAIGQRSHTILTITKSFTENDGYGDWLFLSAAKKKTYSILSIYTELIGPLRSIN